MSKFGVGYDKDKAGKSALKSLTGTFFMPVSWRMNNGDYRLVRWT